MFQYFCPFGRGVVFAQIRFELAREDFESGGFTDTVRTDQTENLTWTGCGETMQFEGVGRVSVGDVGFEIGGEVENLDGFEGAPVGD